MKCRYPYTRLQLDYNVTAYAQKTIFMCKQNVLVKCWYPYTTLRLDYNMTAYAQKTVFMYWWNGWLHILLQQIWGVDGWVPCWHLVSALEWLITGLLTLLSCFPSLLLCEGLWHRIVIEIYTVLQPRCPLSELLHMVLQPQQRLKIMHLLSNVPSETKLIWNVYLFLNLMKRNNTLNL